MQADGNWEHWLREVGSGSMNDAETLSTTQL